jgi:phage gp29-like protein
MRAKAIAGTTGTSIQRPTTRAYPAISKHVTPNDFKKAFRAAQIGSPAHLFEILKFFYKIDDEIPAAMQSLKSAITGNDFAISPHPDQGEAAIRQAAVFESIFREIDMISLVDELLDGHYYGFSAAAIPPEAWSAETIDGRTYQVPTTFEVIPRSWLYAKKENQSDEFNTLYLGDAPYYEYPKGAVLLLSQKKLPSYEDVDFTDYGIGLSCIRYATFKYFNEEDAAAFNEVFATPLILGKVGSGGREEVVKKAVLEMGNDSRAVVGENDSIEFPESNKTGSVDVFDRSADRWNKAISKIIKSESLTNNMGSAGSYAAMYTTNGIRKDVAARLKRRAMKVIMRHFVQPIVDLNWGGKLLIDIDMFIDGVDDDLTKARVFREANNLVDLSRKQVYDELNLMAPDEDDPDDVIGVKRSGGLGF